MKYIKKFERRVNKDRKYWLLPFDERFEGALKELGCDPDYIKVLLTLDGPKSHFTKDYIFISNEYAGWCWMPYEGNVKSKFYEREGYKYMGTVGIPDWELEKDTKKYNL